MGGFGSGSYSRWDRKTTTNESMDFDIRVLKKWGYLSAGYSGSYSWPCGGEPSGSIRYKVAHDEITLTYRSRSYGGEWQDIKQQIPLTWTDCHYGGQRAWFRCNCFRRVAVLYGAGTYFRCRHCYQLAYGSQQEALFDRMLRKSRKIRKQLGPHDDVEIPIWRKPKGMHFTTFNRLLLKEKKLRQLSVGSLHICMPCLGKYRYNNNK